MKKEKRNEKAYRLLAKELVTAVSKIKRINSNSRTGEWYRVIHAMHDKDGIPIQRMFDAIEWMSGNSETMRTEKYCPTIESARSFRDKFSKLERYIERNGGSVQQTKGTPEHLRERQVMDGGFLRLTRLSDADLKKERDWQKKYNKVGPYPFDNDYHDSKYWTEARGKRAF